MKASHKKTVAERMEKLSAALQEDRFHFKSPFQQGKNYLLFDATSRVPVLRFVSILSIACPVLLSFIVLRMTTESMISDLGSIAAGRVLQAALILFSCVYAFVMCWLSGKYVLKIERITDGSLKISTWRILLPAKTRVYSRNDLAAPVYKHGMMLLVRAPYYSVHAAGKKLIIDKQGDFPWGEDTALEAITDHML